MNDIIEIMKASKDSVVLIDGVTETAKTWNKNQEDIFLAALLAPLAASLVQSEIRSVVKGTNGRGVGRAGKGCMDKNI